MRRDGGRLVAIDARGYFTRGGVGRYTRNLVRELVVAEERHVRLRLLISNRHHPGDLDLPPAAGVEVVVSRAGWMDVEEENRWLGVEIADVDLFHSLTGHWLPTAGASVATLHDLTPVVRPRLVAPDARRFGRTVATTIVRASHLIADSQATARDARRVFGRQAPPTTVVHLAAAPTFHPGVPLGDVLHRHGLLARGFVLAVSALNPHKNLARLVDASAAAGVAAPLVIVGAQREATTDVEDTIARQRLTGQVRMLGRVTDEDLAALYATCRAFVYPSLYEGFGLPVIEAMACGAAVIASRGSSIPEVAGDAALLIDTSRTASLAAALRRIDRDPSLRQALRRRAVARAATFSWTRAAADTLAVYASALEKAKAA